MLGTRGTSMQREDMGSRDVDDNSKELVINSGNEYELHAVKVVCGAGIPGILRKIPRNALNSWECV